MKEASKRFFLKKEAKTFYPFAVLPPWRGQSKLIKIFWFFFSKKNHFLPLGSSL